MLRSFIKILTLFATTLALAACATTANKQTTQALEQGKQAFLKQDYKQAFPKLFVAAQAGDASAAYAVGYMFYYGKGTKQNKMLGENWINRAASNNNPTAKQALQIIRQEQAAETNSALLK